MIKLTTLLTFALGALLVNCGVDKKNNVEDLALLVSMKMGERQTLPLFTCSPLSLQLVSRSDNQTLLAAPDKLTVKIGLSGPSGNDAKVYSDATCQTEASTGTIAKGTSSTIVYVKSSSAGLASLSASGDAFTSLNALVINFKAAKLTLSLDDNLKTADGTLGNHCQAIRIKADVPVADGTVVTLTIQDSAGSAFYTSGARGGCQDPIATPTSTKVTLESGDIFPLVYFKPGPSSTSVEIKADAPGVAPIAPLTVQVKPLVLLLYRVNTSTDPNVGVNQCVDVNLCSVLPGTESCLAHGVTKFGVSVAGASGVALYSDAQCLNPTTSVTIASDESTVKVGRFYFKGTASGQTATITGTSEGMQPVTLDVKIK